MKQVDAVDAGQSVVRVVLSTNGDLPVLTHNVRPIVDRLTEEQLPDGFIWESSEGDPAISSSVSIDLDAEAISYSDSDFVPPREISDADVEIIDFSALATDYYCTWSIEFAYSIGAGPIRRLRVPEEGTFSTVGTQVYNGFYSMGEDGFALDGPPVSCRPPVDGC